jgi:hypothetical protein
LQLIESSFVTLVVGEAKLIPDEEEAFTVTAYDANHCPGMIFDILLICYHLPSEMNCT